MRIFADLHLHSKYARATSKMMDIENLSKFAKLKGLDLITCGDFTHPTQLKDIKEKLEPLDDSGIYQYNKMKFMLTTEIANFYFQDGKSRRIHHLIHVPSIKIVDQMIDVLTKKGANTGIDGRMAVKIPSPELVEILREISNDIHVVPAHIWTPWYGVLGSKTGFDSVDECYKDQTKYIYALETGLSSDPPMNWRVSSLDKFVLMSNSDSHSPWTWRLGRECNVFELKNMNYFELWKAVKEKDEKKFLYTVEVDPNYGKYHFSGHRDCKFSCGPSESAKLKGICEVCKKPMTIGVLERLEELADREEDFKPKNVVDFKPLLPLYEIISFVTGTKTLYSKKVKAELDRIMDKFGPELNILLNVEKEDLLKVTTEEISDAVIKIRNGEIKYIPGYDGVYGEPIFGNKKVQEDKKIIKKPQKTLMDF